MEKKNEEQSFYKNTSGELSTKPAANLSASDLTSEYITQGKTSPLFDESESQFLQEGTVLQGKYRINRVLGQGGFGITYEGTDLNHLPPEIMTFFSDFAHNPAPDGMEQLSSVVKRAGAFLEEIKNLEGDILISTHAIAMKGILEYLTPGSEGSYWSKYIGNCAIYAAETSNGTIGVPRLWRG